jgi:glutathione peroxidase-family protein|tara:strand:+ start:4535 stop:5134 length:600 start_codon:yes stop_codon:yes gene_type:complete
MIRLISLVTFIICTSVNTQAKELDLGSTMPLVKNKLMDISGKSISLFEAKGENGLLVIFSCNTCPWVKRWEDRYVELAKKYKPKGVGVIAINSNESNFESSESMDEMKKIAEENKYNFFYAMDNGSKLAREFGATKTPHVYLFDKNDKLVYRGAVDDNAKSARKVKKPYVANAIDAMLSGNDIKYASTKALGCGIKFKK